MRLPEVVLVQTVTGEYAQNITPATDPDMVLIPDPTPFGWCLGPKTPWHR